MREGEGECEGSRAAPELKREGEGEGSSACEGQARRAQGDESCAGVGADLVGDGGERALDIEHGDMPHRLKEDGQVLLRRLELLRRERAERVGRARAAAARAVAALLLGNLPHGLEGADRCARRANAGARRGRVVLYGEARRADGCEVAVDTEDRLLEAEELLRTQLG